MTARWYKLGELIAESNERNSDGRFSVQQCRGLSTSKDVIPTVANLEGVSLRGYKVLGPNHFAYVSDTSRRGDKVSYGYNDTDQPVIVSSISTVFHIVKREKLLPEFLHLWLCRPEFDRQARFNSWGSARESFRFSDLCRVEIPVPPIEEQRRIAAAWHGLRELKATNEESVEPLMQLCRSYLEKCKRSYEPLALGDFICACEDRNSDGALGVEAVRGISIEKKFIPTKANMANVSPKPYKLLKPDEFCVVPVTSRNGGKISLACNDTISTYLVSAAYDVFRISDKRRVLPQYLALFFNRPEFDRYARFNSWGSARESFGYSDMCRVKIPLPPIEVQQAVVDLYRCANEAKKIAAEADELSRACCSALIQLGAVHTESRRDGGKMKEGIRRAVNGSVPDLTDSTSSVSPSDPSLDKDHQ